jgi:carboxymethylenebutenolidase
MAGITSEEITFPANGIEGMGYLSRPDDGLSHPGVIVIQEWWGLDPHIRDVADRFAREGFVALAPDLYHGEFATEPDEARKLAMNLNRERAIKDLMGAVRHLQAQAGVTPKQVGCIGFCMGGSLTLALAAATADVAAAAPFYAGMQPPPEQLARIKARMFCAFGAEDQGIPLDRVRSFEETVRSSERDAEVKVYEGAPHSFFNDTRPSYRAEAARDAWERSLALFRTTLK